MKTVLYVRDRDGAFIVSATIDATSVSLQPFARWNISATADQHGTEMLWAYDDQRSIALSPLHCVLVDGSAWKFHGVHLESQEMRVFLEPLTEYADPFAEKGSEKGGAYTFVAKGADVRHGTQLVATATSNNYARRIAEALTLYRGKLSSDRRDQRRRAERDGER